jgi:hypothetical protein
MFNVLQIRNQSTLFHLKVKMTFCSLCKVIRRKKYWKKSTLDKNFRNRSIWVSLYKIALKTDEFFYYVRL